MTEADEPLIRLPAEVTIEDLVEVLDSLRNASDALHKALVATQATIGQRDSGLAFADMAMVRSALWIGAERLSTTVLTLAAAGSTLRESADLR